MQRCRLWLRGGARVVERLRPAGRAAEQLARRSRPPFVQRIVPSRRWGSASSTSPPGGAAAAAAATNSLFTESDEALWKLRTRRNQRRRFLSLLGLLTATGTIVFMALRTIEDNLLFFMTPTQALTQSPPVEATRRFRLGGLVVEGSVRRLTHGKVEFDMTDLEHLVHVNFQGVLPDLFREGQSVVVEGYLVDTGDADADQLPQFKAVEVLAKHDENYMPAEVRRMVEANRAAQEQQTTSVDPARAS